VLEVAELLAGVDAVIVDCRFVLGKPGAGREQYLEGHIPGAHYLHLEDDLSGPSGRHGGRHPLPDPATLAARLASLGIGLDTPVIAYDDSRFAFAARFWWLLRALGYRPPRLLNGGYQAWVAAGGAVASALPDPQPCPLPAVSDYRGYCGIDDLPRLQAAGATLLDSREPKRFAGEEEPIDPVAGHIPGALNVPWQRVSDDLGRLRDAAALAEHFAAIPPGSQQVVYCGSGVTACVNLYALAQLGDNDALLYPGSWSDWCSYLQPGD
jgi:thiosulfate/3-mercaptopyruvate sulfurtransferase